MTLTMAANINDRIMEHYDQRKITLTTKTKVLTNTKNKIKLKKNLQSLNENFKMTLTFFRILVSFTKTGL